MSNLHQPCLPDVFWPNVPRRHKAARQTARDVYRRRRSVDQARERAGIETSCGRVLRILAGYWNRFQHSPTALELLAYGQARGERLVDVNSVRPRIRELVQAGLVEPRAKRRCQVSGQLVWTWAVREAGSKAPR